ncbi:MAG: hypothetical protein VW257_09745, partial [Quisquiliibacterium sp.]
MTLQSSARATAEGDFWTQSTELLPGLGSIALIPGGVRRLQCCRLIPETKENFSMKKSVIALAVAAAIPMVASAADAKKPAPWKAPAPSVTLGGTINTGIVDTGADGGKVVIGSFGG